MAEEEVMSSVSPAPSDHKRKLDDLDSEPLDQPPVSGDYNGNSQPVADGDGDGDVAATVVSTEDPDAKRLRIDDRSDEFAGENTIILERESTARQYMEALIDYMEETDKYYNLLATACEGLRSQVTALETTYETVKNELTLVELRVERVEALVAAANASEDDDDDDGSVVSS